MLPKIIKHTTNTAYILLLKSRKLFSSCVNDPAQQTHTHISYTYDITTHNRKACATYLSQTSHRCLTPQPPIYSSQHNIITTNRLVHDHVSAFAIWVNDDEPQIHASSILPPNKHTSSGGANLPPRSKSAVISEWMVLLVVLDQLLVDHGWDTTHVRDSRVFRTWCVIICCCFLFFFRVLSLEGGDPFPRWLGGFGSYISLFLVN